MDIISLGFKKSEWRRFQLGVTNFTLLYVAVFFVKIAFRDLINETFTSQNLKFNSENYLEGPNGQMLSRFWNWILVWKLKPETPDFILRFILLHRAVPLFFKLGTWFYFWVSSKDLDVILSLKSVWYNRLMLRKWDY